MGMAKGKKLTSAHPTENPIILYKHVHKNTPDPSQP